MNAPDATLEVRLGPFAERTLERVVAASAARTALPIDRLADAQLAVRALCAAARGSGLERLAVRLSPLPDGVSLTLGPLPRNASVALVRNADVPGARNVIDALADRRSVTAIDARREELTVAFRLRAAPGKDAPR